MASATGIPEHHPATVEAREDEPLLGSPGDVTQKEGVGIHHNLITGAPCMFNSPRAVGDIHRSLPTNWEQEQQQSHKLAYGL